MRVRNGSHAMVLLADGHWHHFADLYRQGIQAVTLIDLHKMNVVELSATSARLSERGMLLFDRVIDRMLITVDKKPRVASH